MPKIRKSPKRPQRTSMHPIAAILADSPKLAQHEWRTVFGDKRPVFRTSHFKRWQLQEAKAKFSALFDQALKEGPQVVTRRNKEAVVILPEEQYRKLAEGEQGPQPGMLETLLKCPKGDDLPVTRDSSDNVLNLPPVFD